MPQALFDGMNLHVGGTLTANAFNAPMNSVGNAAIAALAGIEASKVIHRKRKDYEQATGAAVVSETRFLFITRAAGTLKALEAAIIGAIATGADRTVTIDLHKSTGGAAFATVMSAAIQFTDASVLRAITTGAINTTAFIDGDIFELIVTVAGAAGAQAQGLGVSLTYEESPQ